MDVKVISKLYNNTEFQGPTLRGASSLSYIQRR
jgi:hypothetical protein